MSTIFILAIAVLIAAAAVFVARRRPIAGPDNPAVQEEEPDAGETARRVEEAVKGATPYMPESMRDTGNRAGGLRAASENPGQSVPDNERPASDSR